MASRDEDGGSYSEYPPPNWRLSTSPRACNNRLRSRLGESPGNSWLAKSRRGVSMAIHSKEEISDLDDQVFGTSFLPHPYPSTSSPNRKRIPVRPTNSFTTNCCLTATRGRMSPRSADLGRAGSAQAHGRLHRQEHDRQDEYPQMAELESRCVHMIADLWNSPDAANTPLDVRLPDRVRPRCSADWP